MATMTGTHDVGSTLRIQNQSVAEVGVDLVAAALAAQRAAFNRVIRDDLMASLVDITTDRLRISGVGTAGTMMEVDEYGRAPTQKQVTPPSVGFPLKLYQWPIGWTAKWMQIKTPNDLRIQQEGSFTAYQNVLLREIKKSFFLSSNYTFVDRLIDRVSLAVKRLYNADSTTIPPGPFNEVFVGATHTHYTAEATLSAGGLTTAINNVVEHGVTGPVIVGVSTTNAATFEAVSGFTVTSDPRIVLQTDENAARDRRNMLQLNDRLLGYFGPAEVWTKPWAIANYAVIYDSDPANKPLALRQREQAALQDLQLAGTNAAHPLTAEFFEAEFGVGVWNRGKAAVHQFSNGTYVDPTIT